MLVLKLGWIGCALVYHNAGDGRPSAGCKFRCGYFAERNADGTCTFVFMSYDQGAWPRIEEEGGGVAATSSNTSVLILSCLRDRVAGKQNKFLL